MAPYHEYDAYDEADARAGSRDGGGEPRRWVVDAVEEGVARLELEDGEAITLPRWLLPRDAAAGDVLRARVSAREGRATLTLERDEAATRAALRRSTEQLARQPVGDSTGDIAL
jgi:hypothetical protein